MLKYYINHPTFFSKILESDHWGSLSLDEGKTSHVCWEPLVINLMQLTAGAFTEYINIRLMCAQDNKMDTVMNFFALSIIHEIDNLYADSLPEDLPLKHDLLTQKPKRVHTTRMWREREQFNLGWSLR